MLNNTTPIQDQNCKIFALYSCLLAEKIKPKLNPGLVEKSNVLKIDPDLVNSNKPVYQFYNTSKKNKFFNAKKSRYLFYQCEYLNMIMLECLPVPLLEYARVCTFHIRNF